MPTIELRRSGRKVGEVKFSWQTKSQQTISSYTVRPIQKDSRLLNIRGPIDFNTFKIPTLGGNVPQTAGKHFETLSQTLIELGFEISMDEELKPYPQVQEFM